MLATLVIVFREVIEAGLIVGIVLAATKGVGGRGFWVSLGILGGALGACIVALFASQIAGLFQGSGEEIFNASILFAAVVMLAGTTPGWRAMARTWRARCRPWAAPSPPDTGR